MSISYVNINKKNGDPKLSLCKPNLERTKIGNLNDVYNVELIVNMGALNELTFTMPVYVERNNQLVKNPLVEKFNGLFHVRCDWNGQSEYFVYTKGNRKLSDSGKEYHYRLFSSGYLLSKKIIRSYDETSKSLSWLAIDLLRETDWFIDFVDADFDLKKRSYEIAETNVLQAMFDIASKFGALVEWDTFNQRVNFVKPELTGKNKGFKIREGIFLESLDAEINYDEIVTRLYVYGQDGLEFRRLSPTGSNYIESFEWFMHPFEMDSNYNVLKSSTYLSDSLCIAIRKYEKKVADSDPLFKTYTNNKTLKQDEIQQAEQEWTVMEAALKVMLNERDLINATYMDEAPDRQDWKDVIARIEAQESLMEAKENEITILENQLDVIDTQINNLRESLKTDNNYTSEQLREMNKWIISKSYTNDAISNEEDLLEEGLKVFKEYNVPPTSLNVNLVNFLNDFEFEKIKNRIAIADTVTAKIEDFDLDLSMKITQIRYNFESESFNLTVSNLKDLRDNWQQFLDKLYSSSNTSTTVDMDKHLWDGVTDVESTVDKILNAEYDTAKKVLLGGYKSTVTLTDRGLYSKDVDDDNTFLVLNNAIIAITKNAGNSVEVAISKNGVHANKLVGKIVLSKKLWIEDELGVVEIQSGLQTIYDQNMNPRVYLGRYPTFQNPNVFEYGLRVIDGAFDIRTSESTNRGVQIDGEGIRAYNSNGVKTFEVNAQTGQVSIIGGISIKTHPDSNRGVEIDGNGLRIYNDSGTLVFNADHYGNIFYRGKLDGAYGTVDNLGGSIQDMDGTFKGDLSAAGGTFTGTLNGVDGDFSGELKAATGTFGGVVTGSLDAATGTFKGIVTGTISAETARLINVDVDQLRANNAVITNLSAISSDLGTITGGTITIDTDLTVGNNIYLGQRFDQDEKSIVFNNTARINGTWSTLTIGAPNVIMESDNCSFHGVVDFSGATVIGI